MDHFALHPISSITIRNGEYTTRMGTRNHQVVFCLHQAVFKRRLQFLFIMLNIELPLAGITVWAPGIVALGLAVGFLTGMFGVGGGFIITPFLKIVFGLPYPLAVGCGLAQILVTSSLSTWHHWRNRSVDALLGIIIAAGAIGGTETGVRIQTQLKTAGTMVLAGRTFDILDFVLNLLFLVLMLVVGITILLETALSDGDEAETGIGLALREVRVPPMLSFGRSGIAAMSLWIPLGLSFGVGILTGLMGVGGGFINFPALVYLLGVPTLVAVGTSAFQIVFASAYGAVRHAAQGHVELMLVGLLLLGSVGGVRLGARLSHIVGGRKVRRLFTLVLFAGILLIVWDFIR
ncbi:MAG: TSUP family transporter [Chitinivibrionales bacterium]|nr:TSUP family transporter [Chitinivibrionales bacterium]MBD3396807.1 TSUP family transporter [Chitinivibrionales bacterium]